MEVKVGTKIEPERVKDLDRAKMGVLIRTPPQEEVEGQAPIYSAVQCPWCGAIGYAWIDTQYWVWLTCGWCGGAFEA